MNGRKSPRPPRSRGGEKVIQFENYHDPELLKIEVMLVVRSYLQDTGNAIPINDLYAGHPPREALRLRGVVQELEIRGLVQRTIKVIRPNGKVVKGTDVTRLGITAEGLAYLDQVEFRLRTVEPERRRAGLI